MKTTSAYLKSLPLLIFICTKICAQTPAIEWEKSVGGSKEDDAWAVQKTNDGGFIIAGSSKSSDGDVTFNYGNNDFWIVKFYASGEIQWQKIFGGTQHEEAQAIQQTADNGFIVAGFSGSSDGEVGVNYGSWDYWILKLNSAGNIEWKKVLGGSKGERATGVQQTLDHGYVIIGYSNSNDDDVSGNHGNTDCWIVKLDSSGNLTWETSLGGSAEDKGCAIEQTSDGKYIAIGYTKSKDGDVSGNHGGSDFWVMRLNSSGMLLWQKCYGGSGNDQGHRLAKSANGTFMMAGNANSNDGDVTGNHKSDDYWVVNFDIHGNLIYEKCLGGTRDDCARGIAATSDGGFVVTGHSFSNDGDVTVNKGSADYWVVKLNKSGNISWQVSMGGPRVIYGDYAYGIFQADDGYVVVGRSDSKYGDVTGNHGGFDCWIVKLTSESQQVFYGDSNEDCSGMNASSYKLIKPEENQNELHLTLSPVPTKNNLTMQFELKTQEEVLLVMRNSLGEEIYSNLLQGSIGINRFTLGIGNWSRGVYILELQIKDRVVRKQFVIEG